MKLIRAILPIAAFLLFLSSCTLLKTGIEKRKYRPGFFLNTISFNYKNQHRQSVLAHNIEKVAGLKNIVNIEKKILDIPRIALTKQLGLNINKCVDIKPTTKTFLPPKVIATEAITNTAAPMEGSTGKNHHSEILGLLLLLVSIVAIYLGAHALFPALSFLQLVLITFGVILLLSYINSFIIHHD